MKPTDIPTGFLNGEASLDERPSPQAPVRPGPAAAHVAATVVIGELVAIVDGGTTPLVRYEGQLGTAALRARSVVDLHGRHVAGAVVLAFESGDPSRPVVLGIVAGSGGWPLEDPPAQVEVDVDGARMIVSARDQLVLRCGDASITLARDGRVLIEGSFVSSKSSGVNLIAGGSIHLN